MVGIKIVKHESLENFVLLLMTLDGEKIGSLSTEIIEDRVTKIDPEFTVTKHLGGTDYFVFTGVMFNEAIDAFNGGELEFDKEYEVG